MARDFNQNRNTNAHLGSVDEPIKKPGTFYALTYGYDGLSYFKVDFPDFVKDFIQGNNDTFEYFVPNNITSIRPYAFSGFPNLNDLTIMNETEEVTINANALSGTKIGNKDVGSKIWVVDTYYDDYVADYGEYYNFGSFESETWYVVKYEKVGSATLTKQLLNNLNIPLTFSGLVIASDINYVTSISVSELTSIEQMWFKALNNLIFDLDELPNGWVYDNGTLYVSPTDYGTFIANHSGYENYIEKGYSMTISGSGTLTSAIVASAIDDLALEEIPISVINGLVIADSFTGIGNGAFDVIDNYNALNNLSLTTPIVLTSSMYSNFSTNDCKFVKWICTKTGTLSTAGYLENKTITYIELTNATQWNMNWANRWLFNACEIVYAPELVSTGSQMANFKNNCELYAPKLNNTGGIFRGIIKIYAPIAHGTLTAEEYGSYIRFIGTNDATMPGTGYYVNRGSPLNSYFNAIYLTHYYETAYWSSFNEKLVGVIDGDNKYQFSKYGTYMNYPKLTGIDTEANIQLLTPADNSLYLASDTGNLWQYSSGTWTNLFVNYSATWYSDEDCTTTVLPSAMDIIHTYYVKLTAI